jgi:hypothetical protein
MITPGVLLLSIPMTSWFPMKMSSDPSAMDSMSKRCDEICFVAVQKSPKVEDTIQ